MPSSARHGALERIEQQRRGGEALVAGAQHIGRADIAGADRADVAEAGDPRQDQAEGHRAEEIADDGGGKRDRQVICHD